MVTSEVGKVIKYSKSKTYLLPLISQEINIKLEYLICNTYIKFNINIGNIECPIGILFELENSDAFSEYNLYLIKNKLFFKSYIINETHKLYIFNFPEKFINEYKLFKEGKYSKFGGEAKSLIIAYSSDVYKYPPLIEDLVGVLYKHPVRREKLEKELNMILPKDSELASKIVFTDETFYFNI